MEEYIKTIESVFDVTELLGEKMDNSIVRKYYLTTHLAYLLLHSPDGFVHMGISYGPGFRKADLAEERDISENVLPSMERLKRIAMAYYRYPAVTRLVNALLPVKVTQNSITALLMPDIMRKNVCCYYLHVLQKPV